MKLTVLGSGSPIFNPDEEFRYSSCHLIEIGEFKILLDAGVGVLPQLAKLGLKIQDIDVIAVSHFHHDHFVIGPLMQALFLEGAYGSGKPSITICGPVGLEVACKQSFNVGFDFEEHFMKNTNTTFVEFQKDVDLELKGVKVSGYKTKHFDFEAISIRIEAEDRVFTYSGDSTDDVGLQRAAEESDLLLCESAVDLSNKNNDGHVNAFGAAKIAKESKVKKLVLTHYSGNDSDKDMVESAISTGYEGEVLVSKDLSTYVI